MQVIRSTSRTRVTTLVVVIAAALAAGCGGDGEMAGPIDEPRVTAGDPDADLLEGGDATPLPVDALLGTFARDMPPDAPDLRGGLLEVTVPENLEGIWRAWAPAREDVPPPPEVPAGRQPVVVWFAGSGLTISGYDVDDGELVIVGDYVRPGESCVVHTGLEGTTFVLALDDPDLVAAMPPGEPRLAQIVEDC